MANFALQIAVSLAVTWLSQKYLQPDKEEVLEDSKPTSLAERNAPIPFLLGVAYVAPVLLWAGDRDLRKEKTGSGKGFVSDIESDIFYEGGWHGICLGPAYRMRKVLENGKRIIRGPISVESHPSSTTKKAGQTGDFELYWGEQNQPENGHLGDPDRVGVASRWPFLCYVEWNKKRLGISPTWARHLYEMEVRPFNPKLIGSSPWVHSTRTLRTNPKDEHTIVNNPGQLGGPAGINVVVIGGARKARKRLKPGTYCLIEGNGGIPDGDYLILDCIKLTGNLNELMLQTTIPTPTQLAGTVIPYDEDQNDGVNAAHALYQLIFEPYPHGRGENPDLFDINSLEELGILFENEGISASVFSPSASNIEGLVSQLMQDLGVMIALDPRTGLQRFMPLRSTMSVAAFPDKVMAGAPVTYERIHLDVKLTTRLVFTFRDRNRDYAKMSISISDDGVALDVGTVGADVVDMPTINNIESASVVALRRSQEIATGKQPYTLRANRQAQLLMPGQLFSIPGIGVALLCLEKKLPKPTDLETRIKAVPNYYAIPALSPTIQDGGGLEPNIEEAEDDLVVIPFEIPTTLLPTGSAVRLGVARVRAHDQTLRADIHLSSDDITFSKISEEGGVHIGGTFNSDIDALDVGLQANGFEFTELGPDILQVLDLTPSGQRAEWRRGRQVILTSAGEVMFLRGVTSLGGDQWRAEQVLRGRLDSVRQSHTAGDSFIIMASDQLETFTDVLMQPGDTVYLKVQPIASDSIPLDEIDSIPVTLYGKGTRPSPLRSLRAAGTDNRYELGDDVFMNWGYLSEIDPKTGAGEQGAGTPIPFPSIPNGTFTLRFLASIGGVVKRTVTGLTDPFYNYTWADIASDFNISPGFMGTFNFAVELEYVKGSLISPTSVINLVIGSGTAP